MHFDNINNWPFVLLIIPISVMFLLAFKSFGKFGQMRSFLAYSNVPAWRCRYIAYFLYAISMVLIGIGLMNPYTKVENKDKQYSNVRIIFVVDVSRSMVYAEDVKPNRLEATKKEIKDFYNSMDGIYECSILPFAGDVNPYFCPFTTTRVSFLSMLDELEWRSAPTLGTDLTKAMEAINDIYIKKDKIDKSGFNIIILLSDGGKEESMATNRIKLLTLTRDLSKKNFKIYTVGVGSNKPAPLTVRDSKGGLLHYITDSKNQIATSQLDEEILKQIADNGKGKYYNLNSSGTLSYDLQEVINQNRKLVSEKTKVEKFYLQPYIFSVTVILLIGCLLLNKVKLWGID